MPSSSGYVLRPAARADLVKIWNDGATEWGSDPADRYADGLFAVFDLLTKFPELAREREEFLPAVRIHPSGSHLVIYRMEGQGVEIIRILHAHLNLAAYLQEG